LLGFVVGFGYSALRAGLLVRCECPRVRGVACAGASNSHYSAIAATNSTNPCAPGHPQGNISDGAGLFSTPLPRSTYSTATIMTPSKPVLNCGQTSLASLLSKPLSTYPTTPFRLMPRSAPTAGSLPILLRSQTISKKQSRFT
jgi:hypothetical protein